jgi:hypothetical protein
MTQSSSVIFICCEKAWACREFSQIAIVVVLYPQILVLIISEVISLIQTKVFCLQKVITTPFKKSLCEELQDHRHVLAINQYR